MGKRANKFGIFAARVKQLLARTEYRMEFAVFFIGVTLGVYLVTYVWSQPWAYRRTGQGLRIGVFPTVFLIGLIVFSILCLIDTYKKAKTDNRQEVGTETTPEQNDIDVKWWPVVVLSVAVFAATYSIPHVDPVILVAGLGLFILGFGGIRRWYLLVGTAVGLGLFVYVFFIRLADIFFPTVWLP